MLVSLTFPDRGGGEGKVAYRSVVDHSFECALNLWRDNTNNGNNLSNN
jgi:hypothetical protein